MIEVLTIDDHPIFRQGIRHLLESELDINPVGETGTISEALKWLDKHHADVVLLDHNLTGINGAEAIPLLLEAKAELQIIMLTVSDDNRVFLHAIRNGACGYVLKDTSPVRIIEAIRAAKAGECRVSDSLVRTLFKRVADGDSNTGQIALQAAAGNEAMALERGITQREIEVLKHLLKGLSNKEIANALDLSPNTVRNQLQRLQELFQARNRVQLALFAFDAGIGGIR